jgi:hypothetical protein
VLLSYFDPEDPGRSYCGYCPEIAGLPRLLKIKRQGGALLCVEPEVLAGEGLGGVLGVLRYGV